MYFVVAARPRARRPGRARAACPTECMHGTKSPSAAEHVEHRRAHAGHDPHARDDVRRVGDLDADVGDRRAERAHAEGHDVHRAAAHAAVEEPVQRSPCISRGSHPVVRRAGVALRRGCRRRCGPRRARRRSGRSGRGSCSGASSSFSLTNVPDSTSRSHMRRVLLLGAVAPVHGVRLAELGHRAPPRPADRRAAVTGGGAANVSGRSSSCVMSRQRTCLRVLNPVSGRPLDASPAIPSGRFRQ